jgi:threonine/homoserine/homoserine lactone efflux protein
MLLPLSAPAIFIFSFIVGFGAVITPGPVSIAIVSQSPRGGWLVGPWVATGHSLLELGMVFLIFLGIPNVLAHPILHSGISLLGGIFLAWMGLKMVWDIYKGRIRLPTGNREHIEQKTWQLVLLGVVATISNPFWYAWWITVAAGYLLQAQTTGLAAVISFYTGHISADYAWDTILSAVIGSGRSWLNDKIYQALILVCGLFLLYLSITFGIIGITGG